MNGTGLRQSCVALDDGGARSHLSPENWADRFHSAREIACNGLTEMLERATQEMCNSPAAALLSL